MKKVWLSPRKLILCMVVSALSNVISMDVANNNLHVIYQWKQIDYDWPNEDIKKLFPDYKQEDNIPVGLEVYGDRLFITIPRWKRGVLSTLNYIRLNDSRGSPPLTPFPSWEAQQSAANGNPEIVSAFRIKVDKCDRLWVLDTGLVDILGNTEQQVPPSLLVYDLITDTLLRKFAIPEDQRTPDSLFANIAVEDYDCQDSYAYLGDLGGPGLVVYSWKLANSWLVKHHYFHPDPKSGDFNVGGVNFHWSDGIFGMGLEPTHDGYSILYFHPLTSTMEFSVSTKVLREHDNSTGDMFHQFKIVGTRGPNGQSATSFVDPDTGVLIYSLTNLNTIACWKTGDDYSLDKQGKIYVDNVTMVFPNDIKIDRNGMLWVLSDRLPTYMYQQLDPNDYNFRILTGNVRRAIEGTVCSMGLNDRPTTPRSLLSNEIENEKYEREPLPSKDSAYPTTCSSASLLVSILAGFALLHFIAGR